MSKLNRKELIHVKSLLDCIGGNIWWKDKESHYLGCNEISAKKLGFDSSNEFIGKTDYEFPWADQAACLIQHDKEVMETGKTLQFEEKIRTKTGEVLTFMVIKSPLKNIDDEIIGTVGNAVDISNQKKLEETLKQAKEKAEIDSHLKSKSLLTMQQQLESVIDSVAGNHWWKDVNGVYRGYNSSLLETLGFKSLEDVIGKTDYELPWSEQADYLVTNDKEVMRTGVTQKWEEEVTFDTGKKLTFLVTKIPLRDENGQIIGTIGSSVDITRQKEIEEELRTEKKKAEKANQLKIAFIRDMQHDFRTPCAGIFQLSEILEQMEIDKEKKKVLRHLVDASKQLLELLNSILDFSRIESETIPLLSKNFDLNEVIQKIVAMEKPSAKAKNLELLVNYPRDTPYKFIGDEFRTHRILMNLMSNAIKFTSKGFIKVSVELAKPIENREAIIKLIVEDTGIGLSDKIKDKIYEKFTRGDDANRGLYKGLGLGLHIIKQFVTKLGGEIEVESNFNHGTTFSIILPLKVPLVS